MILLFAVALLFAGSQLSSGDVCQDAPPSASLNCSTVTADMCDDTQLGPPLKKRCPLACGACNCTDLSPFCATHPEMCTTSGFEQYVADNCQETCNFCGPNATTVATTVSTALPGAKTTAAVCEDHNPNCPYWVASGDCTNPFYDGSGVPEKECPKSCGLCTPTGNRDDPTCHDAPNTNCEVWNVNHYCENAPPQDKIKYCKKTCGLC